MSADLAHLGYHGLYTPDPPATLQYFVDLLGMDIVAVEGDSTYLRACGDYESWSLQVIRADHAGSAWVSWRTAGPEALQRRISWLESNGHSGHWVPRDRGIGPSYEFADPDGHVFRLYYETERYQGQRPAVPTGFQRYAGRGANVRRLDHVNLLARDVRSCRRFWEEGFGLRTYEIVGSESQEVAAWMSSSIQGHELIYTQERTTANGRLHHFAYVVDSREEVLRAAEIFADARVRIEAGPSRHTAIQGFYLYTREPGGNRIEVAHGGYLVFAPDSEPYVWNAEEWKAKPGWGAPLPPEFHLYGTPDVS
ncbi:VOC family protein [Amycolatopsis jejuensis]|uniref:VOC family protein n=1 Tax=Amycolatopsis jejuensis TaxID=330084 RepID=UPI000526D387|nr:VOC family protein [Amycolatopsis jejuensis]